METLCPEDGRSLFTSCSLRLAAWAGWYSAFGDEKKTEQFIHKFFKDIKAEIKKGKEKEK